jgi:transposase-like protein
MACPYCKATTTKQRKKLTKLGYKTYYCKACQRKYNERTGSPFNWCEFPTDIIYLVVFHRLRYKLSLRDVTEIFLLRGIELTHETVRDWEERFASLFTTILKAKRQGKPGKKIHVDETYLKVKGEEVYLYRAIDKHGNLVDVMLSKKRDLDAAEAFFKKMRQTLPHKPEKITTDGHSSYPKAIRKVFRCKVEYRTSKFLNNYIEQDHRGIKQRYYPMRGFKNFEAASRFCEAFEEQRDYFRTRTYRDEVVPLLRQRTLFKTRFEYLKKEFIAA